MGDASARGCRCATPASACYQTKWGDTIIFCVDCCPRGLRQGFGLDMKRRNHDFIEYWALPRRAKDRIRKRRSLDQKATLAETRL